MCGHKLLSQNLYFENDLTKLINYFLKCINYKISIMLFNLTVKAVKKKCCKSNTVKFSQLFEI